MNEDNILRGLLKSTFSAGVETDWNDLRRYLKDSNFPEREEVFKSELRDAILNHSITPSEFEKLTAIDQDSQDSVVAFLVKEIWEPLYGEEPVKQ